MLLNGKSATKSKGKKKGNELKLSMLAFGGKPENSRKVKLLPFFN
jgi:hypothetical protein